MKKLLIAGLLLLAGITAKAQTNILQFDNTSGSPVTFDIILEPIPCSPGVYVTCTVTAMPGPNLFDLAGAGGLCGYTPGTAQIIGFDLTSLSLPAGGTRLGVSSTPCNPVTGLPSAIGGGGPGSQWSYGGSFPPFAPIIFTY